MNKNEVSNILNISINNLEKLIRNGLPISEDIETIKKWISSEAPILKTKKSKSDKISNKIIKNYNINLDFLLNDNKNNLKNNLSESGYNYFLGEIKNIKNTNNEEIIKKWGLCYYNTLKFEKNINEKYNKNLLEFVSENDNNVKIIWSDVIDFLNNMPSESIQLMVTSPPYYNVKAYSQWDNINLYLDDMRRIIKESYRVLENHRVFVFNVGDIFDNDNLYTKSVWGKRKIPLSAYFIKMFEEEGFTFVDDFIWDKGEVQSKRQTNSGKFTPFYQYPINCFEHILIFHKHELDKRKLPCPVCGSLNVNGNTQTETGIQSWECKNENCFERSESNRGKRFSAKTNMTQYWHNNEIGNHIDYDFIYQWRRDIIKLKPVFKINNKGDNTLGHSAPFPTEIPEMAVRYYSYVGDKVLDPFAGSFTTPIVANSLNRIGIGTELNKDLFRDSILKRINDEDVKFKEYELLKTNKI